MKQQLNILLKLGYKLVALFNLKKKNLLPAFIVIRCL